MADAFSYQLMGTAGADVETGADPSTSQSSMPEDALQLALSPHQGQQDEQEGMEGPTEYPEVLGEAADEMQDEQEGMDGPTEYPEVLQGEQEAPAETEMEAPAEEAPIAKAEAEAPIAKAEAPPKSCSSMSVV